MAKHLFMIHGRSFKPDEAPLAHNWNDALRHALTRDHGEDAGEAFDAMTRSFIYYGDISNLFLQRCGRHYDQVADTASRDITLAGLKAHAREDFLGEQGRASYAQLEGKSSIKEFIADVIANPFHMLGAGESIINAVAPDMANYWDPNRAFGSRVRWRLTKPLARALADGDDILLLSHSLGSIVAWDVLWKYSYYGEWRAVRNARVNTLVTLGSPLGNSTVKSRLKGASATSLRRFPTNIGEWHNFAAEDDFISQDETVADDFEEMLAAHLLNGIHDHRIVNLAMRNGRSNPHHSVGYLVHPEVAGVVADWMQR